MGLIKDALKAVIRIDQNLNYLCKGQDRAKIQNNFQATYLQKPIEPKGSTYDRVMTEKEFSYPDCLTFGGRIRAIRLHAGLTQAEFGVSIDVSNGHISNVERDEDVLSMRAIKDVAVKYNIDRNWIITGHLPQTTEEPAKPLATCMVTPMSGYENAKGIDWGDPAGDRPAIMTLDDLKQHAAGKPLQTLEQMKGQMENIKGFYSQTRQSTDVSTSDLPS